MLRRTFVLLGFLILLSAGPFAVGADETTSSKKTPENSTLLLSDLYFQPQFRVYEPSHGGIDSPQWYLGVKTAFSNWVDAKVSVGSGSLLYRPAWSQAPSNGLTLIDGAATIHSLYGDLYAGQFLVPWGLEGSTQETKLWFPRSLLYENGFFPLRDVGAGFKTEYDGFYMNIAAHNGEGGSTSNADDRIFVTGQWGYEGTNHTKFGFSGTAGHVAPPLVSQEQHIRGANAFFDFNISSLALQLEGSFIESVSSVAGVATTIDEAAWHSDLEHSLGDHVNLLGRYEQLFPNTRVGSNILGRAFIGFDIHSRDNVSRLFVYGIKNTESTAETPNDEIRIAWRLTPLIE